MQKIGYGIEIKAQWIIRSAARSNTKVKVQDVFIYFYKIYYLGREDQVRYTVLGKRIHVSKVSGTRPSALYGTWQKDTCE